MKVYVTWDTGVASDLAPDFSVVPTRPRIDSRHKVMTLDESGRMFGNFRGRSNMGLPYDPRPDLVLRSMYPGLPCIHVIAVDDSGKIAVIHRMDSVEGAKNFAKKKNVLARELRKSFPQAYSGEDDKYYVVPEIGDIFESFPQPICPECGHPDKSVCGCVQE